LAFERVVPRWLVDISIIQSSRLEDITYQGAIPIKKALSGRAYRQGVFNKKKSLRRRDFRT